MEKPSDSRGAEAAPHGRTSGKAIAAFVLGLFSFCLWVLAAIPAIIFGILSLGDIGRSEGRLKGTGLAIAGIVLGCVNTFICVPILAALLLPAVSKFGEAANRAKSANNLRQLAIAMHIYHDEFGHFPPAVIEEPGKMPYSWRVAILPYIEEERLYKQYRFDEPWDGPNNSRLLAQMPEVFQLFAGDPATATAGQTYFRVFVGPNTALGNSGGRAPKIMDITDGPANTILIVEASEPTPWLKPEGLPFEPDGPLPSLGGHLAGGSLAAMANAAVITIRKETKPEIIRAAITRSGNEVISVDDLTGR